jgi:anti-anti-sigma regulatory factor
MIEVTYHREAGQEFDELKQTIGSPRLITSGKDVAVDLSEATLVVSSVIGCLARLARIFQAGGRMLHIICNPRTYIVFESVHLVCIQNIALYREREQFDDVLLEKIRK